MKNQLFALAISVFLILSAVGVYPVLANPNIYASMPRGYIHSPVNATSYSSSDLIPVIITLAVRPDIYKNESSPHWVYCHLDDYYNNPANTIKIATEIGGVNSDGWLLFNGQTSLTNLTEGKHTFGIAYFYFTEMASFYLPSTVFYVANSSSLDSQYPSLNPTPDIPVFFQIANAAIPTASPTSNSTSDIAVTPTPTPTVSEFSWLVIVPLLLAVFSVAVIVRHLRVSKQTSLT